MDFARFPRLALLCGPTPVEPLRRLSAELGVRLYVKRDDFTGIGGGGNKLRKLEFLLGEALAQGADTVITVGARQSNHARQTAAVCARAGLACELVLPRIVPREDDDYLLNGNVLLNDLFGAVVHDLPGDADVASFIVERLGKLAEERRKVYFCPVGGSSAVGALGYAACAGEIERQAHALGVEFSRVTVANGSGGTQAGLAAGFAALGKGAGFVRGYAVYSDEEVTRETTYHKTIETLALIAPEARVGQDEIEVDGRHRGAGYGLPTAEMVAAVRLMARSEGLLLDPVYSGKAFAGVLHDIRSGHFKPGENILFVMTGGVPGLYAYRSAFEG